MFLKVIPVIINQITCLNKISKIHIITILYLFLKIKKKPKNHSTILFRSKCRILYYKVTILLQIIFKKHSTYLVKKTEIAP